MRLTALLALLTLVLADNLTPLDHIRKEFYNVERNLWLNVLDPEWAESGVGDVELTKAFVAFDSIIQLTPPVPRPPLNLWWWKKPLEQIQLIEGMYKNFLEFLKRQGIPGSVPAPVKQWLDLAESILMDTKTSVPQAVKLLEHSVQHGSLFRRILQDQHPDLCELQMSPHQLIYDMYNTISLTEIKAYAMMQFSWMLLRVYGKGNFTQEANLTRQRYGQRTNQTAAAARAALSQARRDLYKCDPQKHIEGETYEQVTRLLQGYIENEVDMNDEGTCRENCAYYTLAQNHGCFKDQFCIKQPKCKGRIIDCQYVDSDMWVCPASERSSRRYEWIEYENGRTLGNVGSCTRGTTKVDSWWRWLFWHCSYCMCLCDDADIRSHRYFSLAERTSDVKTNKIVTGVRLVKSGRVFHLQITQGILGERGSVTPHGSWGAITEFDPSDKALKEGVDYHTLTYERRAIDLDDLDSPAGHVLTGVRFTRLGAHLHFEIRSTPFNYATGRLQHEKSQWLSNDNTDGTELPRSRLVLQKPDIPSRSHVPLPVDSTHDQYVEFTHSDFDADAAQSTVPFIDVQPVQPFKGAALLSGAGLMHRGADGSGGFIQLKVFTYDFSRHVQAEAPDNEFYDVDTDTTEIVPPLN
ncbi:uncharacterized protein LOC131854370 isoform X3 [Achroia grisella]|uniref:uncharacterized protein LOC131854370 isoform X3 n=1 Tax=Achroia grisella TaxID=688607 RepID=UPI0027D2C62E|nr:uncharacterized protein LOC131854370 isoform X3 [Achroia grisella]